jgi:DNA-binding CsgD family transcriptional regulator
VIARVQVVPWPLAGRDGELEAFDAAWADPGCRGVTIHGEVGAGKSRLAEAVHARAVRAGFSGGRATASAAAAAVPLGAIAHLIPHGVDLSDPVKGFADVAGALAGPRQDRRWALLIDDLQWLDAASAVLLRQLMDTGIVRLIGTVRTGEPAGEAVQALCRGDAVHRIDLAAFSQSQIEAVLRAVLGAPMNRRSVRELHTASGGNMLYLHELVLGALRSGSLAYDGEIWELAEGQAVATPRLAELIGRRLADAPAQARPVLELLALCEPLSLQDAQAMADLGGLAGLEEAGLVRATIDGRRTSLRLAHPLYSEALRAGIPPLRKRRLLLDQAGRIRAYGARRRDDTRHIAAWQLAATGTADAALLAEAAALARYAHDYQQVVDLLQSLQEADHTTATRLMLGETLSELGCPGDAERVLAAADAAAGDERDKLAIVAFRTMNLFWAAGRSQQALAVNDAARAQVTSQAGLRVLRHNEGMMRLTDGDPAQGLALLSDMEPDIHGAAAPAAWLAGVALQARGLDLLGRSTEAVALAERAYRVHLEVDQREMVSHPAIELTAVARCLATAGQLAEARAVGEQSYAELTSARAPLPVLWAALGNGRTELLSGHPASARRWYAEAVAQARAKHQARPLWPALHGLAVCAALLGDLVTAGQAITGALDCPPLGSSADLDILATGWLHVADGDLAAARKVLADGAARERACNRFALEAVLLTDIARLGGAAEVAGRLAELAQVCDGPFASARASLAAALAVSDPGRLLSVAADLDAIGADLMAAEAASAAAAASDRAGERRKAAAAATAAAAYRARCEGARTPLLAAHIAAPLTARQRDIAALAATGTPSKDIAAALHLSVRTVENHLQSVYAKLGVTTRRDLAEALAMTAVTARSGTVSPPRGR